MITASAYNIHIEDGHDYSKHQFDIALGWAEKKYPFCEVFHYRSYKSLRLEWAAHNLAYAMNIARERTRDVDLNIPQAWYVRLLYAVAGRLAWIIIK